ncbi:unnamed protein product [Sphagnum balticum]
MQQKLMSYEIFTEIFRSVNRELSAIAGEIIVSPKPTSGVMRPSSNMIITKRRVSLPPLRHGKENSHPMRKVDSKNSLNLKVDMDRSIVDIKVVQIESFVDESLLVHLPVSRENIQLPGLDEMPSVELESPTDLILHHTPQRLRRVPQGSPTITVTTGQ